MTFSCRVQYKFIRSQSSSIKEISLDSEIEKSYNFFNTSLLLKSSFAIPRDIASSAVFLSSDKVSFITGITLVIDSVQTIGVM